LKFDIKDLIRAIGNKQGLVISDDILSDSPSVATEPLPEAFISEVNRVLGAVFSSSEEGTLEARSRNEMYELIPSAYLDEIAPIGDNGERLMSFSDLCRVMKSVNDEKLNSNEYVDIERSKFKACYAHDDFPIYSGLEHSWRMLEADYKVIKRNEHPAQDPLSSFSYYVEGGFYPPPEVMIVIGTAIERYLSYKGEKSLDEVFFGEKYQKTKSFAYKKHKKSKYHYFHFFTNLENSKKDNPNISFEDQMAQAIESTDPMTMELLGFDPDIDIDTFLRGYRRWKKDLKERKYD
jgi:hypothetical protein